MLTLHDPYYFMPSKCFSSTRAEIWQSFTAQQKITISDRDHKIIECRKEKNTRQKIQLKCKHRFTITTNAGFSETISFDHFIHFPSSTRHAYGESTQKCKTRCSTLTFFIHSLHDCSLIFFLTTIRPLVFINSLPIIVPAQFVIHSFPVNLTSLEFDLVQ